VPPEKRDPFKRSSRRLLSVTQRTEIVHCPKRDFGVNLADTAVGLCKLRHVKDPRSQRMRLRRYAQARAIRHLENLARRYGEDSASRPTEEYPCFDVSCAWSDADRDVNCHNLRVVKLIEGRLDRCDQQVADEPTILDDNGDPPVLRPVDSNHAHPRTLRRTDLPACAPGGLGLSCAGEWLGLREVWRNEAADFTP
jgi:hypothetical protein